mmetsp:Transcript_4570/g.13172  ORF Transcript_4570/g.13172 Transcript_4570/m.13172 type:complete len:398 (+) Transcript_4570:117-1310(+)
MAASSSSSSSSTSSNRGFSTLQVVLLVCFVMMLQTVLNASTFGTDSLLFSSRETAFAPEKDSSSSSSLSSSSSSSSMVNPLAFQKGQAPNLPSVRVEDDNVNRKIYGGKGDKKHLGGFTEIDMNGLSPAVWKHMVEKWTVQSVLDVGCGRGISTSWFYTHGLRVQCVEGSHDAIEQSMLPDKSLLVEHDFSRGPWWPGETFDAVWSVEFLEHVNVHNHFNYVSAFRKAAILIVSSSRWGGWHHVEVHKDPWWIRKYEAYGFRYSQELTDEIKKIARQEKIASDAGSIEPFPPNGQNWNPQHIFMSIKVFINPVVAALPEHAHLFGELGCFTDYGKPNRECGVPSYPNRSSSVASAKVETPLDDAFKPLVLNKKQDEEWYKIVEANISPDEKAKKDKK